jgi:hypothetical protein
MTALPPKRDFIRAVDIQAQPWPVDDMERQT